MDHTLEIVESLEIRVIKLLDINRKLSDLNEGLQEKNSFLEAKIDEQRKVIEELAEKNNFIKITNSVTKGKETVEAKIKINDIVREIDRCISLINH
jgi:hypothetical protein